MKTIPLTQGHSAVVDDRNYQDLSQFKWYAQVTANTVYAKTVYRYKGGFRFELMHRRILGLIKGDNIKADHRDGDGLNNQRSNLRTCTMRQNNMNRRKAKTNTSGYKGVTLCKIKNKWKSSIRIDGRSRTLGYNFCIVKAAKLYDEAAAEHFGEFANTNKVMANCQKG